MSLQLFLTIHFHLFLMGVSLCLCAKKRQGLACISTFICIKRNISIILLLILKFVELSKPEHLNISHYNVVTHYSKYKNGEAYISGTIWYSQEISTYPSPSGSRLGLKEIWSYLNDKKHAPLKKSWNNLMQISLLIFIKI